MKGSINDMAAEMEDIDRQLEREQIHLLRATIAQQADWLREITTERDALKLRVAELEEAERLRDESLEGG